MCEASVRTVGRVEWYINGLRKDDRDMKIV